MSIPVDLAALARVIAGRRPVAYLVTVGDDLAPRVVSVEVASVDGDSPEAGPGLMVGAGRRTAANIAARPQVTLFWPVDEYDSKHTLVVDGIATGAPDRDQLLITPSSAILHRVRAGRGA